MGAPISGACQNRRGGAGSATAFPPGAECSLSTGGVENRLLPLGVGDLVLRLQDARGGRPARAATLFGFIADSFWEEGKYVSRMDQRLKERPHECEYEAVAYRYGAISYCPSLCSEWHCRWA